MCLPYLTLEAPKMKLKAALRFAKKQYRTGKELLVRKSRHRPGQESSRDASDSERGLEQESDADQSVSEVQISLDDRLTTQVKDAILQNREIELEQARTAGLIKVLDRKLLNLHKTMFDLEVRIGQVKRDELGSNEELNNLEAQLSPMENRFKELEAEKDSLTEHLRDVCESQRAILAVVFVDLDPFCVDNGFIGRVERSGSEVFQEIVDQPDEPTMEVPKTAMTTSKTPKRPPPTPVRSVISYKRELERHSVKQESPAISIPPPDPKAALKADYQMARAILIGAEEDFDFRQERFQQKRTDFEKTKAAAGKKIGPKMRLKMDAYELHETQRLTQALAEAEDEFARAKEACHAAEVDVGMSDLESGFLDDVNDGYRMSEERDMVQSVDPASIKSWLAQIPDASTLGTEAISQPPESEVDVDDWDAASVEIEDSASMVADGPWRRRIDKWQAMCRKVDFDEWFARGWDGKVFCED